jgi:anti-sigma factor RsiW
MRLLSRRDAHEWSQRHLSHYVDGDLGRLARRRLEHHAQECPECSRGIRALRALLRYMHTAVNDLVEPAPPSIFDKVRADAGTAGEIGA